MGHVRLDAQLGAGGMGVVYRARDEVLDRDVAVKVLPPGSLADEAARRRFRQEAQALARLSHPNIGQVFEFSGEGEVDFLAMELIEGETLGSRLRRGPLEGAEWLRAARQLAGALEAAHEAGIIHRDLKPGNLRLTTRGDLKVLDFGLSKLVDLGGCEDSTRALTEARAVTGTFPYMAPEQLRAEPVDPRTDIWAAGVVLFELATGRRPFDGEVLPVLTDQILHSKPPSTRKLNPELPEGVERVVERCLEKDAQRRFQNAGELRRALEDLDKGRGSSPGGRGWVAAAAAALLLLGGLAAGWKLLGRPGPAPIASLAVLPLANLSGDAGQEYFVDGMTDVLITELTRLKGLKVISRTSCMRFKNSKQSLPEIAKALGVEAVIEGTVHRAGGRVRVNAQLIRAATDEHLWAEVFDRQEEDVLALHSQIARAIAGQVKVALGPEVAGPARPARKVKPEAFDLVLQGRHLLENLGNPNDLPRVTQLFEKAAALDPQSVEAHAGIAASLQQWSAWGFGDYWEVHPRIVKEVDAALALDPNHSWALWAKGQLSLAMNRPLECLEFERRATEADPNNSIALGTYGLDLLSQGDPRGEDLVRRAVELDPLGQVQRCNYMTALYCQRRFSEAEAEAKKILDLDPHWFFALDFLFRIHFREGKRELAQEESRKTWKVAFGDAFNPPEGLTWEAYDRWLEQFLLKQSKTFVPVWLADLYARRGDKRKALDYLEQAAKANKVNALMPLNYPEWDLLRDEPRFHSLVEKQGLSPTTFCRAPGK
ncbi:MAG: protein kinase [Acidobacteria bacterium]|nr:protein kinase [Acidobacteriota bacterium]